MQQYALELVMVAEARDSRKQSEEDFKRAILSANPEKYMPILWPDAVRKAVTVHDVQEQDLEDSAGTWQMPEGVDPMEAEQILADLMRQQAGGQMTLDDVEQHE